jgi:hypothetical protein
MNWEFMARTASMRFDGDPAWPGAMLRMARAFTGGPTLGRAGFLRVKAAP